MIQQITDEPALSPRETDILAHHARGLHRAGIAHMLSLSVPTVDFHTRNLRAKLKAQTNAEAVAKGFRHGLLS